MLVTAILFNPVPHFIILVLRRYAHGLQPQVVRVAETLVGETQIHLGQPLGGMRPLHDCVPISDRSMLYFNPSGDAPSWNFLASAGLVNTYTLQ